VRVAASGSAEGVLAQVPAQREVERDLASYEAYVANAAALSYVARGGRA
jgi:hypothetical protein